MAKSKGSKRVSKRVSKKTAKTSSTTASKRLKKSKSSRRSSRGSSKGSLGSMYAMDTMFPITAQPAQPALAKTGLSGPMMFGILLFLGGIAFAVYWIFFRPEGTAEPTRNPSRKPTDTPTPSSNDTTSPNPTDTPTPKPKSTRTEWWVFLIIALAALALGVGVYFFYNRLKVKDDPVEFLKEKMKNLSERLETAAENEKATIQSEINDTKEKLESAQKDAFERRQEYNRKNNPLEYQDQGYEAWKLEQDYMYAER